MDDIFQQIGEKSHEQLVFCNDNDTGLKAIIAIHDTTLGPALGGTRFWPYFNDAAAIHDVLRLSRGMTYKAAISGLNLGGGKAVIIGDPKKIKTEALLKRYGAFIDSLNGRYITAEDVNMSEEDMGVIRSKTAYVSGLSPKAGGLGDPSSLTAYTTFKGIKAACNHVFGLPDPDGRTVLVQGLGSVGGYLVKYLTEAGSHVIVTDIFEEKINAIRSRYPQVNVIDPKDVYTTPCDIYAPCALGATINDKALETLNCKIIAGAANNQLADEEIQGNALIQKKITYAPDFLINSGGLMLVDAEYHGQSREDAFMKAETVYDKTLEVLQKSEEEQLPTQLVAMKMAEERLANEKNIKLTDNFFDQ